MFQFSTRKLFGMVAYAALACASLMVQHTELTILVVILATIMMIAALIRGIIRKQAGLICLFLFSIAYFLAADGGITKGSQNYLPSHWVLNHVISDRAYISSGIKPSQSLFLRAYQDIGSDHSPPSQPVQHSFPNTAEPVQLPRFTTTSVSITVTARPCDNPANSRLVILAHCWFVIGCCSLPVFFSRKENWTLGERLSV